MLACDRPQYSAHCPRNVPGRSASIVSVLGWPGTTSFMPESSGTQNEWMTLLLVSDNSTGRLIGMCISLAVRKPVLGSVYVYCQNHCRAATSTCTTSGPVGVFARSKIVATVGTAIVIKIRNGMIVQLT